MQAQSKTFKTVLEGLNTGALRKIRDAAKVPTRRKALSGADISYQFRNFAIGKTVSRSLWRKHSLKGDLSDCYWIITRVSPKKMGSYGTSMRAWGIFTWKGKLYHNGEERKIPGFNKAGWRLLDDKLVFDSQKHAQLSNNLYLEHLEQIEAGTQPEKYAMADYFALLDQRQANAAKDQLSL